MNKLTNTYELIIKRKNASFPNEEVKRIAFEANDWLDASKKAFALKNLYKNSSLIYRFTIEIKVERRERIRTRKQRLVFKLSLVAFLVLFIYSIACSFFIPFFFAVPVILVLGLFCYIRIAKIIISKIIK